MQFIKLAGLCFMSILMSGVSKATEMQTEDFYLKKIQPLFEQRCVACHSCFNAPCQFNLQNYDGFIRGAQKKNVYDGTRLQSVIPSRLGIDAHSPSEWRTKGFFPVLPSNKTSEDMFLGYLKLRREKPDLPVIKPVADSQICTASGKEFQELKKTSPHLGMPYGFPPLSVSEMRTVEEWVKQGAPGPLPESERKLVALTPQIKNQVVAWERFLNGKDKAQQLVSRYIYEHMFLAHIYFPEEKDVFFRL
ncbi:MAG: fatty acid cis/trans isomerase, partial [Bdellovibrio sp.]